jgi:hypothetical protein
MRYHGTSITLAFSLLIAVLLRDHARADYIDRCAYGVPEVAVPASNSRHLKISRDAAAYVVRHAENACRLVAEAARHGAPLEQIAPSLTPALAELRARIVAPIVRLHADAATMPADESSPRNVFRASKKDLSRSTATWLMQALVQAQQSISKASLSFIAQSVDANASYEPLLNAFAELAHATKVVSDAYPDIWREQTIAAIPNQVRTAASDDHFRKTAVPHGSVKLTASAITQVRTFIRQARSAEPHNDLIASLGWAIGRRQKEPEDKSWTAIPEGLQLGAYSRSQLPPDLIDQIDGIDILITVDDPDRLLGKTIDFGSGQFLIRD